MGKQRQETCTGRKTSSKLMTPASLRAAPHGRHAPLRWPPSDRLTWPSWPKYASRGGFRTLSRQCRRANWAFNRINQVGPEAQLLVTDWKYASSYKPGVITQEFGFLIYYF